MKIINPNAVIEDVERNIFNLRQLDYEKILPIVQEIVKPVEEIGFTINLYRILPPLRIARVRIGVTYSDPCRRFYCSAAVTLIANYFLQSRQALSALLCSATI